MVSDKTPSKSVLRIPATEEEAWRRAPDVIRQFLKNFPDNEHLCNEVAYIIEKRLKEAHIEYSNISCRAKSLGSFIDKLKRKTYDDPFKEIEDLAGVRIVYLYIKDCLRIEQVISNEFEVLERVDKLTNKAPDEFGYGAVHIIVKLGKRSSGARYDDLKDLVCEIQLRTVVQDAWAIIQQHLMYKQESQIPKELQRKLNSLAGLFETADDQFERIRTEREEYLSLMKESQKVPGQFLATEINIDSLKEYCSWKFPELPVEGWEGQLQMVLEDVDWTKFTSLRDIDDLFSNTEEKREKIRKIVDPEVTLFDGFVPATVELVWALALNDERLRGHRHMPGDWAKAIKTVANP